MLWRQYRVSMLNSRLIVLDVFIVGDLEYLQLTLSGGLFRWLDVLELWRVGCELVKHASSQIAHARLRWLLDVFDVFEHARFSVAHT